MPGLKFRLYIATIFFGLSLLILGIISATLYLTIQTKMFESVVEKLQTTVTLGSRGLDINAMRKLTAQIQNKDLTPSQIEEIESSDEYRTIYNCLNYIRDTDPELILYTYILVPGPDAQKARFLVDADVLRLKEQLKTKGSLNETISSFNRLYDISLQPLSRKALQEHSTQIAKEFVFDKEFNIWSMMGIAPISDPKTGEFLGVLGVDISSKNYNAFMSQVIIICICVSAALLLLIFLATIALSSRISQPLMVLTEAVRIAGINNAVNTVEVNSNIKEIWDLKTNFNSMAIKVRNYQTHLEQLNKALERFVPYEFLNFLSKANLTQVELGDQIQKDMAVMFSDIRGFTSLSEHMTPKQTFNFLNEYLGRIAPIIRLNGGFIDKYLGDGIMAIFPRSVDDSVRAAVGMAQELRKYNLEREQAGFPPVLAGTGVHVGTLMMGTIGEAERMQTTVISDSVNMTSRIEDLTKDFGVSILISREVFDRLSDPEQFMHRFIGYITVKGRSEQAAVLEIFDADDASLRLVKAETRKTFEDAVQLYHQQKYGQALVSLQEVYRRNPQDRACAFLIARCQEELAL